MSRRLDWHKRKSKGKSEGTETTEQAGHHTLCQRWCFPSAATQNKGHSLPIQTWDAQPAGIPPQRSVDQTYTSPGLPFVSPTHVRPRQHIMLEAS